MCGIAGALDLTGTREFPRSAAPGDDRARSRIAAPTTSRSTASPASPSAPAGCRSSTSPADVSPSPTRRATSGSPSTASSSSIPSFARSFWPAGTAWPPGATPRRGSTSTRIAARRCSRRRAGSSPSRSGTGTNRTLILGRDRVGICPLYYAERDGWLLWGSEVKALLASGTGRGAARPAGDRPPLLLLLRGDDADLLRRREVAAARPFPPGQGRPGRAQASTGTSTSPTPATSGGWTTRRRWWTSSKACSRQAVERRLRGDVPVVSYISGGLDSTVVLGMSSRQRGEAVPSFTIGLDRAGPDERPTSTESAQVLGSRLTTVTMDRAKIADTYPELIDGRRRAGARHLVRRADEAGRGGPRAGVQGRPDRRGGRRGAGRLRLVQDAKDPRRGRRPDRPLLSPARPPVLMAVARRRPRAPAGGAGDRRHRGPPSKTCTS